LLANLPVARSPSARNLFFVVAACTAAMLLWAHNLALSGQFRGLTTIYFVLFTYFDTSAAMCALVILVFAIFVPGRFSFRPLLRWVGEHPLLVAALTLAVFCAGALLAYRDHPLAMDEYAQFFQSQVFASGHLSGRFPAPLLDWLIPRGFQNFFLAVSPATGQVASSYWPSFSLLLTPFTWLGVPWLCNPLISALTLLVIHRLALELFADTEAAGLAVLLTVASPVFFANGISYYSMPAHLLANCTYALLLLAPTSRKAFLAGVLGSIALTIHNPVPHALFALPFMAWVATRPGGVRLLFWLCVGYLPLCLVLGVGWFWFLDHLSHEIAAAHADRWVPSGSQRLSSVFAFPGGTVFLARTIGVMKVWLWAVPVLVALALMGAWKMRRDLRCWLLVSPALLTLLGYLFVPVDQGHGWGFRYFHSAWVALPLLAVAALKPFVGRTSETPQRDTDDLRTFVVACALLSLTLGVGLRAKQIHEFISDDLDQLPAYTGAEPRVVFLDTATAFYGADLVQNDPWLRGNVIHMLSQGEAANAEVMREHFPKFHPVFEDVHGTVWSAGPSQIVRRPPPMRAQ
jgi:hypothetical protein